MKRGLTGHYVPLPSSGGERARAFVPAPLPPNPPLLLSEYLQGRLQDAMLALGRLDGLAQGLPDPAVFLWFFAVFGGLPAEGGVG